MSPGLTLRALGVVVALTATLTGTASASPTPHAPVVATTDGLVRGVAAPGHNEFLGIPYAAPPVGALRWQPPQAAARWSGVRDASEAASPCAQTGGAFGMASIEEDCLYLNVFAPRGRANSVMVWIHGGAFVSGAGSFYDPTELVRDGVLVVTINYRIGALGFLAHPALADAPGGPTGDYGLMDQQAALRWVARNIARFGGNPHDVTIFGESAGAFSVLAQLVSSGARGLFDRAIVQSGAYSLTQESLASAEASGQAYATAAGCADQSAACLRGLPVNTLLAHQAGTIVPHIDGRVLTQSLGTAFASGQFARVPIINGSNRDEWRLFVAFDELAGRPTTADNYVNRIAESLGVPVEVASFIAAEYPLSAYPSAAVALGAVGTDVAFACPALTVNNLVSQFVPTYWYEFNDQNAPELLPPVSFPQGAAHAAELPYLFDLPIGGALTPDQERLATTMRRYWTDFAERGKPGWPRFDPATQQVWSLVPPRPQLASDFAVVHNCDFWADAAV